MSKLRATFAQDVRSIIAIRDDHDNRMGVLSIAVITEKEGDTIIEGPTHDVMRIIGAVADHGEDTLREVHVP